jgi:serine/threonine-protein kinase
MNPTPEAPTLYDLVPGKEVAGRWRVVGPNRQGGLSTAFEVVELDGGERRELQLFPSALFETHEQARDFKDTWLPWTHVNDDAVLRVRDVVLLGETTLLLVTDLPFGRSLRKQLDREGSPRPEHALAVGKQLLRGLVAVHAAGLVHGDVKPHTIHVRDIDGAEPRAMMVDGGVTPGLWTAKHLGEQTALIGTPYYAPVEQFGGESPDVQSDVYNVATVLFELATGVLPWPGRTFLEIFQAKLDRNPPSMKLRAPDVEVDPALEDVIVQGLLADRSERHQSAKLFLEALEAL